MKTSTKWIWGVVIVVLILLFSLWTKFFPTKQTALITNPNLLPGIATTTAPWSPEIAHLQKRLQDIGLGQVNVGSAMHIHVHLDLSMNGVKETVPADIGINVIARKMAPIHTHNASGVIHIESSTVRNFTLGEFFDVWGVRFTKDCLGGYCNTASSTLRVYENGKRVTGNPRALVLKERSEIAVVYAAASAASSTPAAPSSYTFPLGE